MSTWLKVLIVLLVLGVLIAAGLTWFIATYEAREPSRLAYGEHCADCHGADLNGSAQGPALVGAPLKRGDSTAALIAAIAEGHTGQAMADWRDVLPEETIKALALFVSEQRQQIPTISDSYTHTLPDGVQHSRYYDFRVELFAELQSRPYSMAPLPDGRILVSEKVRGLSIVVTNGTQGELVSGTPRVWEQLATVRGSYIGLGMFLEVALHPEFDENGWIYLSHTERCQLDCGSWLPVSMVRVVRGKIRDGRWVDEEIVWHVHHDHYTVVPDGVACGRLAFDGRGHLFLSVGGKSTYDNLHVLDTPYGKIHRVRDDGTVPEDNPFWSPADSRPESSTRHTVWSYGHRTSQGLEAHPVTGAVWNTEMGPRGGDEVNRIIAGGNYGWPLYTNGLDYDGKPVTIGEDLGLTFAKADTVLPVVDFTPAPSLSSFTFHNGDRFPSWKDDLLVGSLRARTLYRLRIRDGALVEQEKLLSNLGRIRDVEMGADGLVYVLLEHGEAGSLVRLVPL